MPTTFLPSPFARALLAAAAVLFSAAARAGVDRAVEPTGTGARVTVSWTAAPSGLSSALLVRETLPAGASVSVSSVGASGSSLAAVRREGSVWSFLVPRAAALAAGSFDYEVVFESEAALPVSGVWRGLTAAGVTVSGAVGGAAELPGRIPVYGAEEQSVQTEGGGGAEAGVVPGSFSIRSFAVEPSEGGARVSFSWTGSGGSAVEIQWTPSLAAPAPAGAKAGGGAEAVGWTTLATVVPGKTPGSSAVRVKRAAAGAAGAEGNGEETVFGHSIETSAPSGFFRLALPDGGAEKKE